jgi:Ternary complex associated domain 7
VLKGALLLDAAMSVQDAVRRLAQHGYWLDPDHPAARSWLQEYVDQIAALLSGGGEAPGDSSSTGTGGQAGASATDVRAAVPTLEDAARVLARPAEGQWAAVRRQDGITIFWYAFRVTDLLQIFSCEPAERTVREALDFHEYTSTRSIQVENLPSSGPQLQIVLHGQDLVGVKEPEGEIDLSDLGFDQLRGGVTRSRVHVEDKDINRAFLPGLGDAGVAVRGFPFLAAPEKVTVGVEFELEIGISDAPATGVATAGPLELRAPRGTTTIPIEVQVVADGFSAPTGWRGTLEVAVADPTKARVKIPLIPLPQQEAVRLTVLSVQFIVGGVARGAASRNIVVEATAGIAPPADGRGVSWLDAAQTSPPVILDPSPCVPDIELDIAKPDNTVTRGHYLCVVRNSHGVTVSDGNAVSIDLGEDAATFAKGLIDKIRQFGGQPLVATLLDGIAKQIAGKLPQEFFNVLRAVAAMVTDRPITLQLNSAEPYVPWELAAVDPPLDPARPKFLGTGEVDPGRPGYRVSASARPRCPRDGGHGRHVQGGNRSAPTAAGDRGSQNLDAVLRGHPGCSAGLHAGEFPGSARSVAQLQFQSDRRRGVRAFCWTRRSRPEPAGRCSDLPERRQTDITRILPSLHPRETICPVPVPKRLHGGHGRADARRR